MIFFKIEKNDNDKKSHINLKDERFWCNKLFCLVDYVRILPE